MKKDLFIYLLAIALFFPLHVHAEEADCNGDCAPANLEGGMAISGSDYDGDQESGETLVVFKNEVVLKGTTAVCDPSITADVSTNYIQSTNNSESNPELSSAYVRLQQNSFSTAPEGIRQKIKMQGEAGAVSRLNIGESSIDARAQLTGKLKAQSEGVEQIRIITAEQTLEANANSWGNEYKDPNVHVVNLGAETSTSSTTDTNAVNARESNMAQNEIAASAIADIDPGNIQGNAHILSETHDPNAGIRLEMILQATDTQNGGAEYHGNLKITKPNQ